MERPSSPARSTRSTSSNLIRSYTTSSDLSASEQLAAIAKAREERKKRRQGMERNDTAETSVDVERGSAEVPLEDRVEEEESKNSLDSSNSSSRVPKLRIQPTSDRSYTPSVPSSPSRSSAEVQPSSITPATTADNRIDSTTPRPASPARNTFVVSDIPPFRSKSTSPTPASPVLSPIRSPSPTNVVLAGGLLERLKAQRAAQIARTASESGSPTPSTLELDQTSEGSLKEAKESSQPLSTASSSAIISSPLETLPDTSSSITPLETDRPPSFTRTHTDPIPPLTSTSTAPSSFVAPSRDEGEGSDAVSELSTVFSERGRSKSRSRIYGRYGEEIEYDFTALSDVPERSERSSMSTMQGSLFPSHRRQGSAPISAAPSPIRYSTSSSALSNRISNPIASSKSSPSLGSIPSREPDSTVNRRIDATSQLLGRSNAEARSIFNGSRIKSKTSFPSIDPVNEDPTNRGVANRSPIKHTSPEIARRASQFELPASPTKATIPSTASAHPGQVPANSFSFAQDDPLKEIEQRRNARRARIESIRNLYAPRNDPPSPRTDSIRDEWTEVERKEREQAQSDAEIEIKNIYRPTGLVGPFSPISQVSLPLSPQLPPFCEGYLSVPPGHDSGLDSPQHHPTDWISRYSVLNSETLSFRPTDQNSLKGPIIALALSECDRVDEDGSSQSLVGSLRPFSVVLKSGERVHFACEKGSERVRWILALQDAIKAARSRFTSSSSPAVYRSISPTRRIVSPVARTLTPPGSTYSPSRGTLYRDQLFEPILPPLPLPTQDVIYPIEKQPQSPSVWSRSSSPLKSSRPFGLSQQNKIGADAFGSSRLKREQEALLHPLSTERPLPPSPVDHEVIATPERSRQEHSRSQSDFSEYRTRNHEPPFRPSPTRPRSMHSESTITYQEHQPSMNDTRIRAQQVLDEIAPDSTRPFETETLTTRRGIDSTSEKLDWDRRLQDYEHEARHFDQSDPSSVPSPNFVRRARQATSRKLEGLEGIGKAASGFRLPLGKKRNIGPSASPFIDDHPIPSDAGTRMDPFAKSQAVQPQLRRPVKRSDGQHSESRSSRSDPPLSLEELLWTIRDNLEKQRSTHENDKERQEMQAQAISALAHWVTEDTHIRQSQYKDLADAVEGVVQHVANLPQQLLAVLQNSDSSDPLHKEPAYDQDEVELLGDTPGANGADQGIGGTEKSGQLRKNVGSKGFGVNPNSSFARAHRQFESADQNETKSTAMKPKGPRMPGIRLWGAPEPAVGRSTRRGGDAIARDDALNDPFDEERTGDAANRPLLEALGKDTRLAETLKALADGEGSEIDAGTLSHAVFEILQTLREIGQKQTDQAARQAEEQTRSQSLTDRERAELVAKKEEIARIEQTTAMNAERTAKINELVAQLAQRTDKTNALLAEIAKNVKDGKITKMDPALSNEVKKLLGGVQSGVEAHVSDFRGRLTSEVQRMFKEVGKLRDEKKTLQSEIAELMTFHAKHGGSIPKPPAAAVTQDDSHSHAQDPPSTAMTSGFFGPRAMK